MSTGRPGTWIPTPLEVGLFLTVWPLLIATATAVALIAPMWLIRTVAAIARRLRR